MDTQSRELNSDAARFLQQYGQALAFPRNGVRGASETSAYLESERARLSDIPGTKHLTPAQRAVIARSHRAADGVEVRSYVPSGPALRRPVILFLHGGGWVSGSMNLNDTTCRILADRADAVVVSVEYRLAPEHPFPAPLDDCDSALQWVRRTGADLLGGDASSIVIVGGSSGGNLAAALVLRDRDRNNDDNRVVLQVLIYPALDSRMSAESHRPEVNGRDYFISTEQMRWYWEQYRGSATGLDDEPYFSPISAEDLTGLPPAIIVTAELDLLRDDGIAYNDRLIACDVDSQRIHYPDQIHGFMTLLDAIDEAPVAVAQLALRIRAFLDSKAAVS